jgi:zinc protease
MKGWIILAMSLFLTTQAPEAYAKGIFNPSTKTLPNGLQVVLVENHLAPIVSICLMYKVGTADDPVGLHGISHFLEHLMFKGTKDIPSNQFKKIIAHNGGMINAFTTSDVTAYTADIAIEFLDFYLKLEADRMQNLVMKPKEVAEEQKVVLEERLMRLDNNPFGVAYEALLRAIYWYHPYGIPAIGYPQHIAAYTRDTAYEHYKKWYAPNNAILVVAGDITMEKLMPIVEKHFGSIPSRPVPSRHRVTEPGHEGVVVNIDQENPRVSQVNLHIDYAAPNFRGPNSEHYYPLAVLAQILGGNDISRLYKSLITDQKLAVSTSCAYDGDSLDPETLSFSATLAPNTQLIALKVALNDLIREVVEKGVTDAELADAKRDILATLAFARDGNTSSVMTFTRLAVGFTVDQVENWPNQINAVTSAQVHEAAKFVLSKNPVVIMTVYPQGYKEKEKQLEAEYVMKNKNQPKEIAPASQEKDAAPKTAVKGS